MIQESEGLCLFEPKGGLENKAGIHGAPDTPKRRVGLWIFKEYSTKENHHPKE